MNSSRAKKLRWLAKYSVKKWRSTTPKERYRIEQHPMGIKTLTRINSITGKEEKKRIQNVSQQLFCRGPKVLYKHYKKTYYKMKRAERI